MILNDRSPRKRAAIGRWTGEPLEDEGLAGADRRASEFVAWQLAEDVTELVRIEQAQASASTRLVRRPVA